MYVPAELAQHVHTVDGSKPNTQAVGRRPWLRLEDLETARRSLRRPRTLFSQLADCLPLGGAASAKRNSLAEQIPFPSPF